MALGVATALLPSIASAAEHNNIGGGFHSSDAPLGVRWWLTGQKIAFDFGIGFDSRDVGEESLTRFTIDGGMPIVARSWDRVHVLFRPGLMFTSQDQLITVNGATDTDSATILRILLEAEAEVFVAPNVSISASHGLAIENTSPPGDGDSSTDFGLFGNNFTEVGFHVYLFGDAE
jgi:hypothetical protein